MIICRGTNETDTQIFTSLFRDKLSPQGAHNQFPPSPKSLLPPPRQSGSSVSCNLQLTFPAVTVANCHCCLLPSLVRGTDLEQLAQYCGVFPKATISECRAYLYNIDPTNNLYSNLQVHRAEKLLGLKRKAASMTVDLAFLPQNMTCKNIIGWTPPPPLA
jgi:hypothetical protein